MWRETTLADLADITSGGTPSRDVPQFWGGDIPWVTPTDISACSTNFLHDTKERISAKGLLGSPAKLIPAGSILLTSRATVGEARIAAMPVCTNQGFKNLTPKQNADGRFLFYQVQRCRGLFERYAAGSTFPEINKRDVGRVSILHPVDTSQQQKIAAILTSLDTAIEKTEALIGKHQQIKAGLMHDLFNRGVLPNGQLRPTQEQAPELYRETVIGWTPSDWEVSGLAGKSRAGVNWIRTGPFGSSLKSEHWVSHGHPVITIGALGEGEFLEPELLFVGTKDAARLIDFQLKVGDVVFSRVADVGRSVVIRESQAGWIMSSNLMRIAVDEGKVRADYLQMLLAADSRIKRQIRARVNSGGRDVANSEVLNELRFPWPSAQEQDRIVARAQAIAQRMRSLNTEVAKANRQKLGLMQDLLTGKVPVKIADPEAVPA